MKLQNNMKDEEIKALRDRMVKMESVIPVQVRPGTSRLWTREAVMTPPLWIPG